MPEPGPVGRSAADRPPSVEYEAYPAVFVVPFHYENPVMSNATERRRRRGASACPLR